MPESLSLTFSPAEQDCLFSQARQAIRHGLDGAGPQPVTALAEPDFAALRAPMGAFVTLHSRGNLRGCIGMMETPEPLYATVASMAWAAAFGDQRFRPLRREELPDLEMDISVLGPSTPCPDPALAELGRHGLMLEAMGRRSVFLPQVPVEQGWDVEETMRQLARKAGLAPEAWKAPGAKVFWYESVLLGPRRFEEA